MGSKKRKSEGGVPVAKKPKKLATAPSQAKKAVSHGVARNVVGSSDKENGESNASGIGGDTCISSERPKTQTQTKVDKAKAKQKGKEKTSMDNGDAASAAQLAREAVPKFQPINITSTSKAPQATNSAKPDKEEVTLGGSRLKALQQSVVPIKAIKIKVPKGKKESAAEVAKAPKEPKKLEKPKDKVAKKPKEQKGTNLKVVTNPSKEKKKVSEIRELTGGKKKLEKSTKDKTEIREWKQYEPKNAVSSSASIANTITKHLQPMGAVRAPPKLERPPEFEYIEISYPLLEIHDRL